MLTACNHSICQKCIHQLYKDSTVKCPLCSQLTQADSFFNFSNNKALISLISDTNYASKFNELKLPKPSTGSNQDSFGSSGQQSQEQTSRSNKNGNISNIITSADLTILNNPAICFEHQRQMEAFCWSCKVALCIDCLLHSTSSHSLHEVINIDKSLERENQQIQIVQNQLAQNRVKINKHQCFIQTFKQDLEKFAKEQTLQINSFFDDLREIVERRCEMVKSQLKETVDQKSKWVMENETLLKDILTQISSSDFQILSVQLSVHNKVDQLLQQIDKERQAILINDKANDINNRIKQQYLEEFDFNEEINLLSKKINGLKLSYCDTIFSTKGSRSVTRQPARNNSQTRSKSNLVINKNNSRLGQRQLSESSLQSRSSSQNNNDRSSKNATQRISNQVQLQIKQFQTAVPQSSRNTNVSLMQSSKQQRGSKINLQNTSLNKSMNKTSIIHKPQVSNLSLNSSKANSAMNRSQVQQKPNAHQRKDSKLQNQGERLSMKLTQQDITTPGNRTSKKYEFTTRGNTNNLVRSEQKNSKGNLITNDMSFSNDHKRQSNLQKKQLQLKQSTNNSMSRIYLDGVNNSVEESENEDASPYYSLVQLTKDKMQSVQIHQQQNMFKPDPNLLSSARSKQNTSVIQNNSLITSGEHLIYLEDQDHPYLNTVRTQDRKNTFDDTSFNHSQYFRAPSLRDKRNTKKIEKNQSIQVQQQNEQWKQRQIQQVENLANESKRHSKNKRDNSVMNRIRCDSLENTVRSRNNQLDHSMESMTFGSLSKKIQNQKLYQTQNILDHDYINNNSMNFNKSMNQQELQSSLINMNLQNQLCLGIFGQTVVNSSLNLEMFNLNLNIFTNDISFDFNVLNDRFMIVNDPRDPSSLLLLGASANGKLINKIFTVNLIELSIDNSDIKDMIFTNIADSIYHTCCSGLYHFHDKQVPLYFIAFTNQQKFGNSVSIYQYNFMLDQWIHLPDIKINGLVDFKIAVHEYCLYLVGGKVDGTAQNHIFQYDIQDQKWTSLNPMNEPRSNLSLASCPEGIIAISGINNGKVLKSCEVYSTLTEEWEQLSDLNFERSNPGALFFNKKLYVVGGIGHNGLIQRTIECYSQENDKWECLGETSENITNINLVSIQL